MKESVHPKSHLVSINCASCSNVIAFTSTMKAKESSVDICSKCHPFYIGSKSLTSIKGRAEKFSSKVETAMNKSTAVKEDKKEKAKKQPKALSSFEDL
jgi:large subunit ribosomal protein L31